MNGHTVWYFVLKAADDRTLATSELYDTREAALAGIAAVRQSAPARTVNDLTEYRGREAECSVAVRKAT